MHVTGDVDLASAPAVRGLLGRAASGPAHDVVVDLSKVTFMDCAGLSLLVDARRGLGGHLLLRAVPRPVTWLLGLTGLSAAFDVVEAVDPPG